MTTFRLGDKDYPLAMTLQVMTAFDTRFNGFENVGKAFENKTPMESLQECVFMLAALAKGGHDYLEAIGETANPAPTERVISALLFPRDLSAVQNAIYAAIAESSHADVEVDPAKNAEATQGQ